MAESPTARQVILEWLRTPTQTCTGDFTADTAVEADKLIAALCENVPEGADLVIRRDGGGLAYLEQPRQQRADGEWRGFLFEGSVVHWDKVGHALGLGSEPLYRRVDL